MGANNSKIKRDLDEQPTPRSFDSPTSSKILYQRSEGSQRNLVHKLQKTLYHAPSAQSSTERIDQPQSDSSLGSFQKKTKKLLSKKKVCRKMSMDESHSGEQATLASSLSILSETNTVEYLETLDPMTAAVERLSARFDEVHHLDPKTASPSSCSALQRRFECLDYNNDIDYNCNSSQSNSSHSSDRPPISTAGTVSTGSRSMAKQDAVSQKINEEWLSTKCSSSSIASTIKPHHHPITSQDIIFDLFLGNSNESDRRKEKDRQQRMHYLLKHIWKGIHRSVLDDPKTIVNWCSGIGVWDMEMAILFPQAKVIGVDFEGATLSNLQHGIPNLEFKHTVIRNSCTGLESFESNSVDFIMMRDVWLVNAPIDMWEKVFQESFRILKPGGWIEIVEHMLKIESQGPKLRQLDKYFDVFFETLKIDRSISCKLGKFLHSTGFTDIDEMAVAVPLGEWSATASLREIGYLNRDVLTRRIKSLSKWVSEANGLREAEFTKYINEILEEEMDDQHSYMNWESYTARKPLISD